MAYKYISTNWGAETITELASDESEVQPYYRIGAGAKVAIGIPVATVSSEDDPEFPSYEATYNWEIPAGLEGETEVYFGMYPVNREDLAVEWGPYDIISDVAVSAVVSPSTAVVVVNRTRQFTVVFYDVSGVETGNHDTPVWSVDGDSINASTGLFTAGVAAGGPYTVTMTAGAVVDTASVTVALFKVSRNKKFGIGIYV